MTDEIQADNSPIFGLGVFETIAVKKNRPILLAEHLSRFKNALAYFKISQTIETAMIFDYLKNQSMDNGALKITASAQDLRFTTRKNPYTQNQYEKGFSLKLTKILRNETSPFSYYKTINNGENILEKEKARQEGFDEPIFCNTKGEIAEGATTNIFFTKGQGIFTPQVSSGLLNGILRQYVISHFPVTEMAITPNLLRHFDGCFVTNALLGAMPVTAFEDIHYPITDRTKEIRQYYENEIENL